MVAVGSKPVSYTHLDVYKRQSQIPVVIECFLMFVVKAFWMSLFKREMCIRDSRINTVFFVVKIKYLLKVYGQIELTRN